MEARFIKIRDREVNKFNRLAEKGIEVGAPMHNL